MGSMLEFAAHELAKVAWLSAMALTLVTIYLLMLIVKKRKNFRRLEEELGYPTPEVNNCLLGHVNEHTNLKKQSEWYVRFGKIYGFYNCDKPHLRVADLDAINEIFLKQSRNFTARTWFEYRLSPFNRGILFSIDERWRRARRLFQQSMSIYRMTTAELNDHSSPVNDELLKGITKLFDHFVQLSSARDSEPLPDYAEINKTGYVVVADAQSPTGRSIDIRAHGVMEVLALDIILRVGLDEHSVDVLNGFNDPMMKFIDSWLHAVDNPLAQLATAVPLFKLLMPFVLIFNKSYQSYFNYMLGLFKRHNERLEKREKSSTPINAPSNSTQRRASRVAPVSVFETLVGEFRAGRMPRGEVVAHAGATIVAGFETTATTASFILWCIGRHSELKGRLYEEVAREGVHSRYLDMFIKEVMRMYPALTNFVVRSPKEEAFVAGRRIKRGMSVYLGVHSVHYDPTIYPNPYNFDPERFAEGKTYPPGAYVPFGLGHRMCVGYHLAMREMKLIVVEVLRRFDVELIAPQLELERESLTIFLTRSKNDIRVRFVPRQMAAPPKLNDEPASNGL